MSAPPNLKISIERRDAYYVEFESSSLGKTGLLRTQVTPEGLDGPLKELYSGLDDFRKIVGTEVERDYYTAISALRNLYKLGGSLNRIIFGDRLRFTIKDFIKSASFGAWSGTEPQIPSVVTITNKSLAEHWLPFEFLPWFDTGQPQAIASSDEATLAKELGRLAAQFLGFSTVVSRVYGEGDDQESAAESRNESGAAHEMNSVIDNLPRLGLRFFHHAGLPGAQRERTFFTTQAADWLELRGPWPQDQLAQGDFISQLSEQLWNAADDATANAIERGDQIQHFSCHCDTTAKSSDTNDPSLSYYLTLAHRSDKFFHSSSERRASIRELNETFADYDQRTQARNYPIVFLNACGTSKLTASGVTSFPKFFMGLEGNRGVIGSETTIPDDFAAAFSKRFYLNLIRDSNLGQALFRARWGLLMQRRNPLGILYTLYGNPHLRVRRQRPEVTVSSSVVHGDHS